MDTTPPRPRISILLPCHNEESAVQKCLDEVKKTIDVSCLDAEVIAVDNASTDASRSILERNLESFTALKIATEPRLGYGSAYLKGFEEARGAYIFMADCDGTYSFSDIPRFVAALEAGSDLVIGDRFSAPLAKGSMPWHHEHIGNPLLSFIVRLFFKVRIRDIHCGARAITREALDKLTLYTAGMEFASEMIIKASKQGLKITEIPVEYRERLGRSKLRSFSDGWRHLRFILLYSPLVLFLLPGCALFAIGAASFIALLSADIRIFGIQLYVHPIFLSSLFTITGYQLVLFAGFARTYAITHLGEKDSFIEPLYRHITIEKAGLAGMLLAAIGAAIYAWIFAGWIRSGFGSLDQIKASVLALTLITLGVQTFFGAFMLSILGIKEK